jgi:hypothetical protein
MKENVPETVARLTGGEYFKLTDPKKLERDLATISNHLAESIWAELSATDAACRVTCSPPSVEGLLEGRSDRCTICLESPLYLVTAVINTAIHKEIRS